MSPIHPGSPFSSTKATPMGIRDMVSAIRVTSGVGGMHSVPGPAASAMAALPEIQDDLTHVPGGPGNKIGIPPPKALMKFLHRPAGHLHHPRGDGAAVLNHRLGASGRNDGPLFRFTQASALSSRRPLRRTHQFHFGEVRIVACGLPVPRPGSGFFLHLSPSSGRVRSPTSTRQNRKLCRHVKIGRLRLGILR